MMKMTANIPNIHPVRIQIAVIAVGLARPDQEAHRDVQVLRETGDRSDLKADQEYEVRLVRPVHRVLPEK